MVTRAELEDICKDLIARVRNPIETALKAANMTVVRINLKYIAYYFVILNTSYFLIG